MSNKRTHFVKQGTKVKIEIRGLEELSYRERQAVVLKETGQTNAAIARRLAIGEATVATLLHRARLKGYQVVVVLPGSALGLADEDGEGTKHGADGQDDRTHPPA